MTNWDQDVGQLFSFQNPTYYRLNMASVTAGEKPEVYCCMAAAPMGARFTYAWTFTAKISCGCGSHSNRLSTNKRSCKSVSCIAIEWLKRKATKTAL